jgi:tetratricopeptide (TPR) repeat protein
MANTTALEGLNGIRKPRGVSAWRVKTNMAYRTEIERALNEIICDEMGNKFQGLAVVRAQQKWSRFIACERKWDGGLDAHADGALEPDGNGLGLACSTTATIKKVRVDAAKTKEHYPDVRVLIFATPKKVSQHRKRRWAKQIADEFGLTLQVMSREEFVVWLLDPAQSDVCRDQLGISGLSTGEIDGLINQARAHVNPCEAKIAIHMLEQIQLTKGGALSKWQRFRVLTNLGASNLMIEEGKLAARYFLDAAPLARDDEIGVGNEVLAYHLLLQEKETREKATTAIELFPNSTRIRSLWIQSAPQEKTYEELHDATPALMRKDDEVASALCRRALACGQLDRAIEHAKDAVADNPKWSQTHLLLAQAYFARVAAAERTVKPLNAEEKTATLAKSLSVADDAISAAEAECVQFVKAHAFALKTDIALIQGRKEDAARFAREAFGAGPGELNGRFALAESFIAIGNPDEGIRILEEVHTLSKAAANVCFMLGEALLHRGAPRDLKRAFEVFSTANLTSLTRELVDPVTVGAVRALARAERFGEIESYVDRPEVADSSVMVATVRAYAAFRQAHQAETTRLLDQAVAGRRTTDSQSLTNFLGRLLLEAGRASDAMPLLQELFEAQNPNFDVGLLLHCAGLLEKEQVILDACQTLHDRGHRDWELLEFESQYLIERDHQKAISRLREFIAANPDHRVAKLRLAIVAMRYGQNDLEPLSESTLPLPDELPMRYAVAAVRVLQWQEQAKLAVDYAYRLLRAHTTEFEAHKAYLASLMEGARPDEIPATMDEVAIGSAVAFSEKSDGPTEWRVIEDTDKPTKEFEEISASDYLAKVLLGKRVGDTFVLSKSPVKDRIGTITQILSKYTRRFQVVGGEMELTFPGQTIIWTLQVPPPEKITVADIQPMLDTIKARSEVVTKLRDIYRTTAITLNMYGAKLGNGPCEALFDLATSEDDFVRCAYPTNDALVNAIGTLETKSTVVLDLVALTTLRLLGITRQVLTSGCFRFVISAATYTELQELRAKARFSTPHGTMFYKDNQHYMTQTTHEQSEREKAAFEEWMQCVEKNTAVVSVPEIATLDPERRRVLEKVFGWEGLEAAVAALVPGRILWTDDLFLAEYAKHDLGVERVWTQAVVEHLAVRKLIDRAVAQEAYAKLVGFNYQATHFKGSAIVAALRITNGSCDEFPMRQMIKAFTPLAASVADRKTAFLMLGEFILQLSLEPFLPETKCFATKALLDTFPTDPATKHQLDLFSVQCGNLMTLNAVGQADFLRCIEQWKRGKLTL